MKYKRYIGKGHCAFQSMLFCKINRLAYSKKIDKYDITSRTRIITMDIIESESASSMEKMLLFAYFYHIKKGDNFSESEYNYYKKLIIAFGKKKLMEIMQYFNSKDGCVGIKEDSNNFRIVYFT